MRIQITHHAIDRASLRANNNWVWDAKDSDEGILSWLKRKTKEAIVNNNIDNKGFHVIEGMRLKIKKTGKNSYSVITIIKEGE